MTAVDTHAWSSDEKKAVCPLQDLQISLKLAVDTPSRAEIQLEMGMVHQKLQDFRAAVAHLSAVRNMHAGAPCTLSLHVCSRANIQGPHLDAAPAACCM